MISVIVTFLMVITFSILLPTGDQVSDIYFWYNTVNFVGNGPELFGCRACFRKKENTSTEKENKQCRICFNSPRKYYSTYDGSGLSESEFKNRTETFYSFNHGTVGCRRAIKDKALTIELADRNCKNTNLRLDNESSVFEGECQSNDICCVNRKVATDSGDKFNVESELVYQKCIQNNKGCELCIAEKSLGRSCNFLSDITDPAYIQSVPQHQISYPWHIKDRHCNDFMVATMYRINNLTLENGKLLHVDYSIGSCSKTDQCCLRFRSLPNNIRPKDEFEHCFDSVCSQHFKDHIRFFFDKDISLEEWKTTDLYALGKQRGGKLCSILERFGHGIIVPIFLNMLFGIWHWHKDLRQSEAAYTDVLFALIICYPQYKILKLLIKFAFGAINEQLFMDLKSRIEGELISIEPFVESVWQVTQLVILRMITKAYFNNTKIKFCNI